MSTCEKNNIPTYRDINLIFKINDNIVFAKTIDNNKLKFKTMSEIEEYLENDIDLQTRNLYVEKLELDKYYLIQVISEYNCLYNNGIIDWKYNYNDLPFIRLRKLNSYMPITINVSVHTNMGAAGGPGSIPPIINTVIAEFISVIMQFMVEKIICFGYNKIIEYRKGTQAYNFFKKNYNVDKEYIHKVINTKHKWKKGFLDASIYKERDKYEKKIMKDCNYKFNRKTKEWTLKK